MFLLQYYFGKFWTCSVLRFWNFQIFSLLYLLYYSKTTNLLVAAFLQPSYTVLVVYLCKIILQWAFPKRKAYISQEFLLFQEYIYFRFKIFQYEFPLSKSLHIPQNKILNFSISPFSFPIYSRDGHQKQKSVRTLFAVILALISELALKNKTSRQFSD